MGRHEQVRMEIFAETLNPTPTIPKLVYCKSWQVDSLRAYGNTIATNEQFMKHKNHMIYELQKLGFDVIIYRNINGTIIVSTPERKEALGD